MEVSVFSATGDTGTPEAMAPVIVVAPGNRSVVAGSSEATLECIASARYGAPWAWEQRAGGRPFTWKPETQNAANPETFTRGHDTQVEICP
jgi:hypothetical protein